MAYQLWLYGYTKMGHTMTTLNVARVYLRVSTEDQDLQRQEAIIGNARASGYYVAAVYREKASGARSDRPELLRMIEDLQPGEVVIAEKIDRISRLPLVEAGKLVDAIKAKGARLAVPGIVDLSELAEASSGVAKVVLQGVQDMLLRVALQIARDDFEDRRERQRQGIDLAKSAGLYIEDASRMLKCMNRSLLLKAAGVALQRLLGWRGSASAR
ncbi:Resolvase (plasmid) [Pseudomonas syringae]|nr:Resolvase [Pseudomonas syringae]